MAIITCSKCGTPSPSQQLVCNKCGSMLHDLTSSTVHMRIDPKLLRVRRNHEAAEKAPASTGHTVNLQIRGLTERLVFEQGTEVVLGRLDLNQTTAKRFDLTRFGAHERGVSREHAILRFQNNQLTIIDLGSINGTTVNLKRLQPREPYVLSNGDEIMLGRLSIVLRFDLAHEATMPAAELTEIDSTRPTLRVPTPAKASEVLVTRLLDESRSPLGKNGTAEGLTPVAGEKDAAPPEAGRPADGKPQAPPVAPLKIAPPADRISPLQKRDDRQSADHASQL